MSLPLLCGSIADQAGQGLVLLLNNREGSSQMKAATDGWVVHVQMYASPCLPCLRSDSMRLDA
jgi:hypothetical protein